jgi:hypothetical protein
MLLISSIQNGVYAKAMDANGVAVLATAGASDRSLLIAWELVSNLLARVSEPVRQALAASGAAFIVLPEGMGLTDLPEFADLRGLMTFDGRRWDDVRGAGGLKVAVGEEILLDRSSNPYPAGENIALHEVAHMIMETGLGTAPVILDEIAHSFSAAKASGKWAGVYAGATAEEYWAVGVQAYFGASAASMTHSHAGVSEPMALRGYDPRLYDTIADVFAEDSWRPGAFLGTDANEGFTLTEQDDFVFGDAGHDVFSASAGNDRLVGGSGLDWLSFSVPRSGALVQPKGSAWTVSSADGFDTISEVERLQFSDGTLALDLEGSAGQLYRLYQAAFARTPDAGGLGYWIDEVDAGRGDLAWVAYNFLIGNEFRDTYSAPKAMANETYLDLLYRHVLGREADAEGRAYWVREMDEGSSHEDVLVSFSESVENKNQLATEIQDGIWYI